MTSSEQPRHRASEPEDDRLTPFENEQGVVATDNSGDPTMPDLPQHEGYRA